ncbi:MAG: hypothetical protein M5U01_31655 [Ardenticatenaceae bacterium]|nr:hypothetical protein [Ardenticatenaceae bacterium]
MIEPTTTDPSFLVAIEASRQLTIAQAGRLAAALAYLLAVALVAEASSVPLGVTALAGLVIAALIARFSREAREATDRLAALGFEQGSRRSVDGTAALLVLLVALLAAVAAWRALQTRAPVVAPVIALLLFAWQWWFYFYSLAQTADPGAP